MSRNPNRLPLDINQGHGNATLILLVAAIVGQGIWMQVNDPSQILSSAYRNNTHSDGDNCTFYVTLSKGVYTVRIPYIKQSSGGIAYFDLDGINIGFIDTYNVSQTYNNVYTIANLSIITTGVKKLRIRLNGKNASSSDHYVHLTAFMFIKQP